ncbi:MAG TPA: hypothetical protein DCK99_18670 [Blastocatellia bacterium]|nr:hypothetical protein [Blastocatellia bacterium]
MCAALTDVTAIDLLKFVSGGLVGSFIGSYLAHRFTLHRDRDGRLRNFRGFLEEWRAIVEQTNTDDIPTQYFEHVRSFRREAERVRGDFRDRSEFSRLVIAIGHMTPEAIRAPGKPSRDILAESIDSFLQFVRNA